MHEDCSHLYSKLRLLVRNDLVVVTALPTYYNEQAPVCSADSVSAFIS